MNNSYSYNTDLSSFQQTLSNNFTDWMDAKEAHTEKFLSKKAEDINAAAGNHLTGMLEEQAGLETGLAAPLAKMAMDKAITPAINKGLTYSVKGLRVAKNQVGDLVNPEGQGAPDLGDVEMGNINDTVGTADTGEMPSEGPQPEGASREMREMPTEQDQIDARNAERQAQAENPDAQEYRGPQRQDPDNLFPEEDEAPTGSTTTADMGDAIQADDLGDAAQRAQAIADARSEARATWSADNPDLAEDLGSGSGESGSAGADAAEAVGEDAAEGVGEGLLDAAAGPIGWAVGLATAIAGLFEGDSGAKDRAKATQEEAQAEAEAEKNVPKAPPLTGRFVQPVPNRVNQ